MSLYADGVGRRPSRFRPARVVKSSGSVTLRSSSTGSVCLLGLGRVDVLEADLAVYDLAHYGGP